MGLQGPCRSSDRAVPGPAPPQDLCLIFQPGGCCRARTGPAPLADNQDFGPAGPLSCKEKTSLSSQARASPSPARSSHPAATPMSNDLLQLFIFSRSLSRTYFWRLKHRSPRRQEDSSCPTISLRTQTPSGYESFGVSVQLNKITAGTRTFEDRRRAERFEAFRETLTPCPA